MTTLICCALRGIGSASTRAKSLAWPRPMLPYEDLQDPYGIAVLAEIQGTRRLPNAHGLGNEQRARTAASRTGKSLAAGLAWNICTTSAAAARRADPAARFCTTTARPYWRFAGRIRSLSRRNEMTRSRAVGRTWCWLPCRACRGRRSRLLCVFNLSGEHGPDFVPLPDGQLDSTVGEEPGLCTPVSGKWNAAILPTLDHVRSGAEAI